MKTTGQYTVCGTVGQHDATSLPTSGTSSVVGGFWALLSAPQPAPPPVLKMVPAGPGQMAISSSPKTPGYVLQETITLSPPNWVNSPSGSANPVTVPITMPSKYYRLFKP